MFGVCFFDVRCSVFVVCCFGVCCVLVVVCSAFVAVRCLMFVVCRVCALLGGVFFVVQWSLCVGRYVVALDSYC